MNPIPNYTHTKLAYNLTKRITIIVFGFDITLLLLLFVISAVTTGVETRALFQSLSTESMKLMYRIHLKELRCNDNQSPEEVTRANFRNVT